MTHSQGMRMFIKRLTVFMRITMVAAVIVFALSVTTLRMLNLKIGLDMQKEVCLGRFFIYRDDFVSPEIFMKRMNENTGKSRKAHWSGLKDKASDTSCCRNRPLAVKLLRDHSIFRKGTILLKRFTAGPGDLLKKHGSNIVVMTGIKPPFSGKHPNSGYGNVMRIAVNIIPPLNYAGVRNQISEIIRLGPDEYFFTGDAPNSIDSRIIGTFHEEEILVSEVIFMF